MAAELDHQVGQMVAEGEEAISSLPQRAQRIADLLASNYPASTLAAVASEFAKLPMVDGKSALNAKVTELGQLVREEAAVACADLRRAEMWIRLKTPSVSDGNNFGVDVQNYVIGEIAGMRTAIGAMVDGLKSYHWDRAQGVEKVVGEHKQETTQSESKDESHEDVTGKEPKSEGKTSTKKSSSTSLKTSPAPGIADYREYVVAIDVKQYHNTFAQLTDIRHAYIKAHVLFARNMKRLSDPRGEGADGSSRNVMSMF